jgi:uncharacterized membrane protein YraQ (UPF0718 family)
MNKEKKTRSGWSVFRGVMLWLLFALGLLTVVYPRFAGHSLFPAFNYGDLTTYSWWQIPFVYLYSYATKAWGALLFAFTLGGLMVVFLPREKMKKYMSSGRVGSYFVAAALAPVLTVCSCAMIPIFGGLLITGVGLGPAITFLLMAPASNLLALIFTAELISWKFMLFRLIFSFFGAMIIGWLVSKTKAGKKVENDYSQITPLQMSDDGRKLSFMELSDKGLKETWALASKVLVYLAAGVFVISFVEAYLPPTIVAKYLTGVKGVLIGAVIGVPTYTPTLVEIFLIKAMLNMGMAPAAALAFLIGAPMASIPSMLAVSRVVGAKVVSYYAVLAIIVAALAGLVYLNFIVTL